MMQKNDCFYKKRIGVTAICLILLLSVSAIAQDDTLIKGYVREYRGGAIEKAKIYLDDMEKPADLTKKDGSYKVKSKRGVHKVKAAKIWYHDEEQEIVAREKERDCDFELSKIETAKVGAVFSVTGRLSFLGSPQRKTADMIVKQINNAGGIDGHKVELIIYDDEGDDSKSHLAVEKLIIKHEVSAIIGPSLSSSTLASIPLAEKYKTPLISCGTSYRIVYNKETGGPYKWVFKVSPSTSMAVGSIYANLRAKGINKIAIMNETTTFGRDGYRELDRLATHYGLEIVAKDSYDPKDTDMTAMLMKIKASAPEAIINWSLGPAQSLVLSQWYELSMTKIPFYQSPAFGKLEIIELAGKAAEGVLFPQEALVIPKILPFNNPQKTIITQYMKNYMKYYDKQISPEGSYAWDAINLVVDAIKAVGPDRVKIRDYLEGKKDFVGQSGIFNFSADDHNGLTKEAYYMTMVRDGKWTLAE